MIWDDDPCVAQPDQHDELDTDDGHRSQTSAISASVNLGTTTSSTRDNVLSDRSCFHPLRPQALRAVRVPPSFVVAYAR